MKAASPVDPALASELADRYIGVDVVTVSP
jgi:hypothetical protein